MKTNRFLIESVLVCILLCLHIEAAAVRAPLKPLSIDNLRKLVADAEVIATGTVTSVTHSKILHQPRETVTICATITAEQILKGDKSVKTIEIEESYQQFSSRHSKNENITLQRTGPSPPVGTYHKGDRVLVFLKPIDGRNVYRPSGSGNHNAYFGIFQVTPHGVTSARHMFDGIVSERARNLDGFLALIASMTGDQR
ncbi:MAG: hypothetical protein AB9866_13375 [Syntrophobacteraceae bacterium]